MIRAGPFVLDTGPGAKSLARDLREPVMLRREFLLGLAASVASASSPTPARLSRSRRTCGRRWGTSPIRRLDGGEPPREDPTYLGRRYDRYKVLLSFNDLWTAADKRAFLVTRARNSSCPKTGRTPTWGTISTSVSVSRSRRPAPWAA